MNTKFKKEEVERVLKKIKVSSESRMDGIDHQMITELPRKK